MVLMKVAFANEKGGAGRTACALLLTLGLIELGRKVTHAEVTFGDASRPSLSADGLPFDYKPVAVGSIDDLFGAVIDLHVHTQPSRDLILDLPGVALSPSAGHAGLLEKADILLVPIRRGPSDIAAAFQTWRRLHALLETSSRARCRIWLLPVGWTNALSAARAVAACFEATDLPQDAPLPVLPWSVPRLTLLQQSWLSRSERIGDLAVTTEAPQLLAKMVTRLAAQPDRTSFDLEALLGGPDGFDLDRLSHDTRPMSIRAIEAGEDLSWLECGVRPTAEDLDDAPILHEWRFHSIRSTVLEGIVVGHPSLRDGPVRTSMLFYCDKERTFARTLSRYYRLGRPASEDNG
jgi:hypothetical protein